MIISAKPFPSLKIIINSNINQSAFNKDWRDFCFFEYGREALLSGVAELGLKKGDAIIIPAYICDSAIAPLRDYGYKLVFVDIDETGNLPVSTIQSMIKLHKPRALLVVHYFGFIFDLKELIDLCRENNIKVIEDCSHSFHSQLLKENNSKSDLEIFSIRKSLPVYDGGAFRLKSSNFEAKSFKFVRKSNSSKSIIYLLGRLVEWTIIKVGINFYSPLVLNLKKTILNENEKPQSLKSCYIVDPSNHLKCYLGNDNYLNSTVKKIQTNFRFLQNNLKNYEFDFSFDSNNTGSIPQVFLVKDDSGGLLKYMNSKGVGAYCWPNYEMPKEVRVHSSIFPNSIKFDKTLVLLPIHQDIKQIQLNYMVECIQDWFQNER